jgi:hypothetical protein
MVYGWYLTAYQRFKDSYDVVAGGVEQEEEIAWLVGEGGEQAEMKLLTRTDILARSRASSNAIVFNLKSTKDANKRWRDTFLYDMQTLTEAMAVENRIGVKVEGVVIEGMIKGISREWPEGSGFYQYSNSLIYAWVKESEGASLPGEDGGTVYEPEWNYTCNSPHVMGNGQKCVGGRNHTLGKGFRKRAVRDCYPGGVYSWIDYLLRTHPATLESYFVQLPPINRDEWQVERWKRQVLPAEKARQDKAAIVDGLFVKGDKDGAYKYMDFAFPMKAGYECVTCPYSSLCWEAGDPTDEGVWKGRVPNHPKELRG